MRARLVVLVAVVVVGAGLFFAGRASVGTSSGPVEKPPAYVAYTFSPISFDFTSPLHGWALGTVPCHHTSHCLSLRETMNAGESWSVIALPHTLLHLANRKVDGSAAVMGGTIGDDDPTYLRVRFANAHDGWIFGSLAVPSHPKYGDALDYLTVLWSTHDGGVTWESLSPTTMHDQQGMLDLEADSKTVYALAFNESSQVILESSPVHRTAWRVIPARGLETPAGGGPLSGAFVFSGARGWLVEGNGRGMTGSEQLIGDGAWVPWRPPCAAVGDSLAVPAAVSSSELLAECQLGGFASPLTKAAPRGAHWGSTWLYKSVNAGRSFSAVSQLGTFREYFGQNLTAPKPGTLLLTGTTTQRQNLLASSDGGRHWMVVYVGYVNELHFVSANEGAALVQDNKGLNQMIMTFDGGYIWLPVAF